MRTKECFFVVVAVLLFFSGLEAKEPDWKYQQGVGFINKDTSEKKTSEEFAK